jgi:hypothetical protein
VARELLLVVVVALTLLESLLIISFIESNEGKEEESLPPLCLRLLLELRPLLEVRDFLELLVLCELLLLFLNIYNKCRFYLFMLLQ